VSGDGVQAVPGGAEALAPPAALIQDVIAGVTFTDGEKQQAA